MVARLLTLLALTAVVYVPAAGSAPLAAPTDVHAFMLRVDEPYQETFSRTPSFAWAPYDGAQSYDFQLATSTKFDDRTVAWSTSSLSAPLRVPAVSVPLALPWMSGDPTALRPHALYARVRAHLVHGVTPWSAPLGFDTQGDKPTQTLPDIPGLVRWSPVDGATSYEVWFVNVVMGGIQGKVISTTTNVADEREYYSFHQDPSWSGTVVWRVRAVRQIYGALPNALPAVSYGPRSDTFVSTNPPLTTGSFIQPVESVSDIIVGNTGKTAHELTPGFAFDGNVARNGGEGELYRVYIATDQSCVNVVYKGAVVGSPAYAPRISGPLKLPQSTKDLADARVTFLPDGSEAGTFTADSKPVSTSEQQDKSAAATTTATSTTSTTSSASSAAPSSFTSSGPFVDLWDLGRPNSRYWWTVVPVQIVITADGVGYQDADTPQDACEAGVVKEFSRTSQPTTTSAKSPFASGLTRFGELAAAQKLTPSFYRAVLVAWQPAKSAAGYEVQWSRTRSPWRSQDPVLTAATSAFQQLAPGTWFYRVRGIDPYVPGPVKQMTWSTPVRLTIARPTFVNEAGVTTRKVKK